MKLTDAQIATICYALREAAEKHDGRAERTADGSFWQEEAASARELEALFKKALSIQVESYQRAPATAPARSRKLQAA
jgi:hypothetical protein